MTSKRIVDHGISRNPLGCRSIAVWAISMFLLPSFAKGQAAKNTDSAFFKYSIAGMAKESDQPYYVVKYNQPDCGDSRNIKIVRRINNDIAIVKLISPHINNPMPGCIEKSAPANNAWKLSSLLKEKEAFIKQKNNTFLFSITANNISLLLSSLRQSKAVFETVTIFKDAQSAIIKCSSATLFQLCLPDPGLLFADLYVPPVTDVMISGYNRNINNLNYTDYLVPGANGNGITIGIKERSMDESDIDLQKRVQYSSLSSPQKDFHATAISTLAGGAGNSYYSGKGAAWKCSFLPSSFSNLFPDSSNLLVQKNVTVQNHSYGTEVQPYYGTEAVSYDVQTWQNKNLFHVFSSGNCGNEAATSGTYANLAGFANVTGNFKEAKNVITVAAVDTGGNIAPFSSAGPLYDGRMAPHITALGPNGTSDAAALVSGSVAVLQQVYKDSNAQVTPPASLVKAILFNSADDIGNKGPDYQSGFGLLNLYNALTCLQQKRYDGNELQQSQVWTKKIVVPSQSANLKITLTYTDTAGLVNDYRALINDLDLEVVEPVSGTIYKPWCLSAFPNVDSLKNPPGRRTDTLNNTEQVSIDLPVAGEYQVKVIARQVQTTSKQIFHIAYTWDTLNMLRFTSPVHPSEINRDKDPNLKIKWKTAVADTNTTGNLYITFNRGVTWQMIGSDIKIYRQYYNWLVPEVEAVAQLRLDCAFGTFYSVNFAVSSPAKIHVDYLCRDSLRISWQKNTLATAYRLYALGDTAFMKPLSTIADTFYVISRALQRENIYAVQPLLANGVEGARSFAILVGNQGVNCYYTTLQAEPAGDSIKLILELSFTDVDSIYFEKVTTSGTVITSLSKAIRSAGNFTFTSFDNSPVNGLNYYRAKIWTHGGFAYTENASLAHNGKTPVLMYPNPVTRGQSINFMVKETLSGSTLQVTDIMGRVMGSYQANASGSIKTGTWPAGIYLYSLYSTTGTAASGRFIIK